MVKYNDCDNTSVIVFHIYYLKNDSILIFFLGFDNAKTGKLEKDDHFALMVRRDSENEPFNPSRHREDHVYQGYKNSLMYLRRYNIAFQKFFIKVCIEKNYIWVFEQAQYYCLYFTIILQDLFEFRAGRQKNYAAENMIISFIIVI